MRLLAIDTALDSCSVCVMDATGGEALLHESLAMERGHAEALIPLIERIMGASGADFTALDRVAVTIGPGSFTGLRVGIAAARAIALAASVPAVGVTTLAAFAAPFVIGEGREVVASAIDARHGQIYLQLFAPGGRSLVAPHIIAASEGARELVAGPVRVVGSGAAILVAEARAIGIDAVAEPSAAAPDIRWVARLGVAATPDMALPKPLYLRPPDARSQDHHRLPRR